MECAMTYQTVHSTRLLLDTFEEKAFDGDFVLPDYLPEIAAILSCELEPVIENRQLSGNRLMVDGTAFVRVIYVDSSRCKLYCYEASQPFSAGFTADGMTEPIAANLNATVSYVNYRAIGPRRLDVRGAYRIHACVMDTVSSELPDGVTDTNTHLRRCTVQETLPGDSGYKVFAVNEVLDPGNTAGASTVIRAQAAASITDCKVLPGRAIIKGEIILHTLYQANGEEEQPVYEECEHTLLYSQMLDIKGLDDTDTIVSDVRVLTCDVHPETEEGTNKCVLIANLRLCATIQSWRQTEIITVTDAYSTVYPLQLTTDTRSGYHLLGTFERRVPVKQQLELPEGVTDIVDLWCTCSSVSREEHSAVERLQIHLLARDENGSIACYERNADFTLELPISGNDPHFEARVWDITYRTKDDRSLELSVSIDLIGRDIRRYSQSAVTGLEADPAGTYPVPEATLKMVYAGKGESVWEIAKNCHVSATAVMEENQLTDDELTEDSLLLIPIV